jgi:hypothetical protein
MVFSFIASKSDIFFLFGEPASFALKSRKDILSF